MNIDKLLNLLVICAMGKSTSDDLLSHYDRQPGTFTDINVLLKEAKYSNMWIYNKYNRKFYTPEELEHSLHTSMTNKDVSLLLERCIIRDPRAGITAANKQLAEIYTKYISEINELNERIAAFTKRVIDYYQKKSLTIKIK